MWALCAATATLLIPLNPCAALAAEPSELSADQLLSALVGEWIMTGDVRGKPVQYRLQATRTLAGKFVELHMVDVQVPPRYEARVFIGADKTGKVFAHWLDSFGPEYSVPHGEGTACANTLEIRIPYPSGTFRDRFTYDPARHEWTIAIDGQNAAGEWVHFAGYRVREGG